VKTQEQNWDVILTSNKSFFDLQLKQIWLYRDLLMLFVKRDIISLYKQTIFGPLWYFIQPIFTTVIFTFVFGSLANLSTDGIPQPLFYLAGITAWNYFADCLVKTSTTFRDNAGIFGKVYFPRVITPLSIIISNLLRFGIQMLLFVGMLIYYVYNGYDIQISWQIILFPLFVIFMAMQGLGFGMLITAMTTKYRDLAHLVAFGVQLMMYTTTVVYPLSSLSGKLYLIVSLNPMTFIIEGIKACTLGTGQITFSSFFYSLSISFVIFLIGLLTFNRVEKSFVDTI
jgi:lipopolysaccharide transport system permease protein